MRMRWVILCLLFIATTINYLDRAILGVILPEILDRFHFGLPIYGTIQMVFQLAHAGGLLLGGRRFDGRDCFQLPDEARVDGGQRAQDDSAVSRCGHVCLHSWSRCAGCAIGSVAIWTGYCRASGLDDKCIHHAH